jgi:sugar lactone lactonase YvrE
MYFTESFRYAIFAYDFNAQTGTISNRRLFAEVDRNSGGFPDGLTVDSEGYVWSAHCGLGQIVRYSPKGKIDSVIKMPVPRATSCVFGGHKYDTLFITSARETMNEEQLSKYPLSGSIFSCNLGKKGMATAIF